MAHKPVQRFILVGLTLLVMLNGTGFFLLTFLQTGYHRTFGEESEERVSLTMSRSEFHALAWIGKRDFIWKGKVYDFAGVATRNDNITVICHYDEQESGLRDSLSDTFENERSDNTLPKQLKQPIPVFPVFPLIGATAILPLFSGDTIAFNETQRPDMDAPSLARYSPPPEFG